MFILAISLVTSAHADNDDTMTRWTVWRNENRLTCVSVTGGIAWCGSRTGLLRWNMTGGTFETFPLPDESPINVVCAVDADRVWVGTGGGLYRFEFGFWTDVGSGTPIEKTAVNVIEIDGSGAVWVGSAAGLSVFDGGDGRHWTEETDEGFFNVVSIAFGHDGVVWLGAGNDGDGRPFVWSLADGSLTPEGGAARDIRVDGDGRLWKSYYAGMMMDYIMYEDENADGGRSYLAIPGDGIDRDDPMRGGVQTIVDFDFAPDGVLWVLRRFMTDEPGEIQLLSLADGNWTIFGAADGVPQYARDLEIDGGGRVFLADSFTGLHRWDEAGGGTYQVPGLLTDTIPDLTFDRNGDLWCTGFAEFVSRFDGVSWEAVPGTRQAWSVTVAHDGALWFGGWGGISRYGGGAWTHYETILGREARFVKGAATDSRGRLWFGGDGRLFMLDGGEWRVIEYDALSSINTINALAADHEGGVWIGADNGLVYADGESWEQVTMDGAVMPVYALCAAPDGGVWAAACNGVFGRNADGGWTSFTSENASLPENSFRAVAVDWKGVLWVGTWGEGVFSFDGGRWRNYTTADGLSDDNVVSIAVDNDNVKWFGTYYGGVSRFDDTGLVTVEADPAPRPASSVTGIHPNPFNATTAIAFTIPEAAHTWLSIYNMAGQRVRTLLSERLPDLTHVCGTAPMTRAVPPRLAYTSPGSCPAAMPRRERCC